ncbi:MAG: hypothetical protein ABW190_15485 [Rhizobacter sp.]
METIVIAALFYLVFVVLPFKLAAGWLGADRSDWVSCIVAVLIASVLGTGAAGLIGGGLSWAIFGAVQGVLSLAIVAIVTGVTNRVVLGTTFVRGVLITVIGALLIPGTVIAIFWLFTRTSGH